MVDAHRHLASDREVTAWDGLPEENDPTPCRECGRLEYDPNRLHQWGWAEGWICDDCYAAKADVVQGEHAESAYDRAKENV